MGSVSTSSSIRQYDANAVCLRERALKNKAASAEDAALPSEMVRFQPQLLAEPQPEQALPALKSTPFRSQGSILSGCCLPFQRPFPQADNVGIVLTDAGRSANASPSRT